jgi:hypothetical protein
MSDDMSDDVRVIWQKGDGALPDKAKRVAAAAQGELLLKALGLSEETIDTIRYNADKNAQSVNDYISDIVLERIQMAS